MNAKLLRDSAKSHVVMPERLAVPGIMNGKKINCTWYYTDSIHGFRSFCPISSNRQKKTSRIEDCSSSVPLSTISEYDFKGKFKAFSVE